MLQTGRRRAEGPQLDAIRATYLRRIRWLLACGILHGTLIWFGDILTAYALLGFWLVHYAGVRLSALRPVLWVLVGINAVLFVFYGAIVVSAGPYAARLQGGRRHRRPAHARHLCPGRLVRYRAGPPVRVRHEHCLSYVVFLPRIALLFMLGVIAARMGYLTRPERHRGLWRKVGLCALVVGVPLNLWAGLLAVGSVSAPFDAPAGASLANALLEYAGPLMGAGYVAVFMLAKPALCGLAGAGGAHGAHQLSDAIGAADGYLAGRRPGPGPGYFACLGLMLLAAAIMAVQLAFSHWWMARHALGPAEALWRR
ncbi:DUF418 domain-containing protein [Massilia sp. H-1]|nr:DUF418 domain-containing protein [Massilia sp. H-1]